MGPSGFLVVVGGTPYFAVRRGSPDVDGAYLAAVQAQQGLTIGGSGPGIRSTGELAGPIFPPVRKLSANAREPQSWCRSAHPCREPKARTHDSL